jgi:thiol-disulfide isomerase/thioredoxin
MDLGSQREPDLRRWVSARALLVVLCTLLSAAAAGCSTSSASATGAKGYVAGDGSIVTVAPGHRQPLPHLSGRLLAGGRLDLARYRGRVMVVNIWASWCAPCRAESADLVTAARRLKAASFLGIDTRDDGSAARAFTRVHHVPYPSLEDQDGSAVLGLYGLVNPKALPTTLVVDKSRRVAAIVNGPVTATTLIDVVHQVQSERG